MRRSRSLHLLQIQLAVAQDPVVSIGQLIIDPLVIERLQHDEQIELNTRMVLDRHERQRLKKPPRIGLGLNLGHHRVLVLMVAAVIAAMNRSLLAQPSVMQNVSTKRKHEFPSKSKKAQPLATPS